MVIKFLLIIIILVCFILLGYSLSKYYVERKNFFYYFQLLISSISSNINFGKEKIIKIIEENNEKFKSKDLNILCKNYIDILKEKQSVNDKIFNDINILKDDEKNLLKNFFNNLGKYDVFSQTKEIETYNIKFNELYLKAKSDSKKYAGLIIKLALIVGLLVCLLII